MGTEGTLGWALRGRKCDLGGREQGLDLAGLGCTGLRGRWAQSGPARGPRAVTSVASRDPRRVTCPGLAPAVAFSLDGTGKETLSAGFFINWSFQFSVTQKLIAGTSVPRVNNPQATIGTRLGDGASSCGR